jgi:hypothetical protein
MKYEILNDVGDVINTIVATEDFVEAQYPGHYRFVPPDSPQPEPIPDPLLTNTKVFRLYDDRYPEAGGEEVYVPKQNTEEMLIDIQKKVGGI